MSFHPLMLLERLLHAVKRFAGDDLDVVLLKQFDALFGAVEAQNEYGGIAGLLYEGVHVLNIDACILKHGQDVVQTAGGIGHFDRHHGSAADSEAVFLQFFLGLVKVRNDQAKNAEIGGVSQRQSADVDSGFGQDTSHFGQAAGAVFEEYGKLIDFHGDLLLYWRLAFVTLIDNAFCLPHGTFYLLGVDQPDLGRDAKEFLDILHYL